MSEQGATSDHYTVALILAVVLCGLGLVIFFRHTFCLGLRKGCGVSAGVALKTAELMDVIAQKIRGGAECKEASTYAQRLEAIGTKAKEQTHQVRTNVRRLVRHLSARRRLKEAVLALHEPDHDAGHIIDVTPRLQAQCLKAYTEKLKEPVVFTSHVRNEANFVLDNTHERLVMPPTCPPEAAPRASSLLVLYSLLVSSPKLRSATLDSIGAALFASGLNAVAWLLHIVGGASQLVLQVAKDQVDALLSTFSFFPSFLVLGLLSYVVMRWRKWLVNSHTLQGRIANIGTTVGSAVRKAEDPATRRQLFQLYRYLNTIHALTYQSVHILVPKDLKDFVPLGLLTDDEVVRLAPMQNRVRDTLIAWAGSTIETMIDEGRLRELAIGNMMIAELRGLCAGHHDLFVRNMPNVWFALAKLLVDYLVSLQLVQLALAVSFIPTDVRQDGEGITTEERRVLVVSTGITFVAALLMASAYWLAWAITSLLENPFRAGYDSYNSDALMGSSERQLFAVLRSRFDAAPIKCGVSHRSAAEEPAAPSASPPPPSSPARSPSP